MKRNIPSNLLELSQIVTNINGVVSDETLLSILPFVQDPSKEIEKIQAQKQGSGLEYDLFRVKSNKNNNIKTDE
ncbi:MAG: phage portal protein [Clostridia bacterium]|nr:phage portal protein [Clostridia bacterium]